MGGRIKCPLMATQTNHVDFSGENSVKHLMITIVKITRMRQCKQIHQEHLAIPITVVTLLSSITSTSKNLKYKQE